MAFMIKKKRYKFQVDLCLDELSEVSYSKAILFAKVRQLEGGPFSDVSKRMEVQNHRVKYGAKFQFPCKMNANASSGVLETCKCRISIRMEEKGGRHFRKIGFTDINLAEYAGGGPSTQRYILQPYDLNHRLDNSILQVTLNITLKEGDTIFQRPLTRHQPILLPGEEEPKKNLAGALKKSGNTSDLLPLPAQTRNNLTIPVQVSDLTKEEGEDPSHTRNSSTTSHASQVSVGYSSQNSQPGHSRQSSSGESTHGRNLSQSSSDTGFFGSMEKEKRRKKLDGRVDAETIINELMEGVDLDKAAHEDAETSGLQLFVGKDGTVTFDKSSSRKDFEQVVIEGGLCLIEGESQYNSSAVGNLNADGSKDLGIFQISDKYWCEWGRPRSTGCKLKCEDLIDDDVSDDVRCVQEIYDEHKRLSGNGFNAWVAWKVKCEGQNLVHFTSGCENLTKTSNDFSSANQLQQNIIYKFLPGIIAPKFDEKLNSFSKIV